MCYIEEQEGRPLFKVKVVEKGYDDLIVTGETPKGTCRLRGQEVAPAHMFLMSVVSVLLHLQLCGTRFWNQ